MQAEARIARKLGAMIAVGGGDAAGAAEACNRLIAGGARRLLSFGLAGGLHPGLPSGALVVPDVVLSPEGHWPTHPPLAAYLGRIGGAIFSGGSVVVRAADKAALYERTGATAVDLESAAVAQAAARHALPFAVLRAICDPAGRTLPHAAVAALDGEGRIGPWRVARAVIGHPKELPGLIGLAGDAYRARRMLARRVSAIVRVGEMT